jgi:nucleoside-diphosphate-sugar epimerase
MTIGPPVNPPSTPSNLNVTLQNLWALFSGSLKDQPLPPSFGSGAGVDVRDVARICIWTIGNPESTNGERFLASAYCAPNQAYVDVLRETYPDRKGLIPEGTTREGYLPGYQFLEGRVKVDGSKAEKAVGFKYITLDKSVRDTAAVFERYLAGQ